MRWLVLLLSLAMPAVSWLSQQGVFGPTNGALSDRYPTLIVAAGYAFAIWGLIFLWDVAFGIWQAFAKNARAASLDRIRPLAAAGFALTAVWMPVFSQQLFWLALLIIWGALVCLLACALRLSPARAGTPGLGTWVWIPLSLHAGWLSMAAFLNTAQVIVAYRLLPTDAMLPWTLVLFGAATALLLWANRRMRGNLSFWRRRYGPWRRCTLNSPAGPFPAAIPPPWSRSRSPSCWRCRRPGYACVRGRAPSWADPESHGASVAHASRRASSPMAACAGLVDGNATRATCSRRRSGTAGSTCRRNSEAAVAPLNAMARSCPSDATSGTRALGRSLPRTIALSRLPARRHSPMTSHSPMPARCSATSRAS